MTSTAARSGHSNRRPEGHTATGGAVAGRAVAGRAMAGRAVAGRAMAGRAGPGVGASRGVAPSCPAASPKDSTRRRTFG